MQCFEAEVTRTFLFALCQEVNPILERDELLLEEVLDSHGVSSVSELYRLGDEALGRLVRDVTQELPVAA